MRSKMLVAAIAAVFGASGIVAAMPAVAQTTSTSSSTDATDLRQLQQQISALQAKVDQLEQQEQAQQAAPAQTVVAGNPASAWADSTKVGGKMYIDFNNLDLTSNGTKSAASGTGLDVTRFYLAVDHRFNDIWSANLTTDFRYVSLTGATSLYVKKAYVQGDFGKLATFRAGAADMPWIPFVENWYGYRYVEATLSDRLHFANSADWGLHLQGDNGLFNYSVAVVNGGGYKNPSRSNSVDFAGRAGIEPIEGLMFAVGGYSGDLGNDTSTMPALHDAHRYDAMVAWNRGGWRLGGEYFHASNWTTVTLPRSDSADGYSLWGSYDFGPASVFARYDQSNSSRDLDRSLKDTYYNAGVAFPITKGIQVALAYKYDRLHDDTAVDVKSRQIGAWGEVKF